MTEQEYDWTDVGTLRQQVGDQYREVAALAQTIADLHKEVGEMVDNYPDDSLGVLGFQARGTYALMEWLGDWLSNNDAVDDASIERSTPVFEKAHKLNAHLDNEQLAAQHRTRTAQLRRLYEEIQNGEP